MYPLREDEIERINDEFPTVITYRLFQKGAQFPPVGHRERISKYRRMKKLYDGKLAEIYERASDILREGSPEQAKQLERLYIAINLADILVTKPADLLVGEPPIYETGLDDETREQKGLSEIVKRNQLNTLIHESVVSNGYRGDSWIKVRYGHRQDYSELEALGLGVPSDAEMEPIIEHINAAYVFPETSRGNSKGFKAVNIAYVEYVITEKEDIPFLNVERHIPGFIFYERFRLYENGVDSSYGYPLQIFNIGEKVPTGRKEDVVETGVNEIPVKHVPYKSDDTTWEGIGLLEKIESILTAINDRMVQIDYVLWKMMDPTAYGPDLEGAGANTTRIAGAYIPLEQSDPTPGYMTWDARLDQAFKELDVLIGTAFQLAETPQWLFGTAIAGEERGGTGTSHTDGAAIKARFMPILSKVRRIRAHYDKALRDALFIAQQMDVIHGGANYTPTYPKIYWKDGIPQNDKELAEIMAIRTGNKPTIDVQSAIKRQDEVDDGEARQIMKRIENDRESEEGTVTSDVFRQAEVVAEVNGEFDEEEGDN